MEATEQRFSGPSSLEEALEAAEERLGARMAVSSPNGEAVAVQIRFGATTRLFLRWTNRVSGRAGSVLGTGRWLTPDEAKRLHWRPA